MNYWRRDMVFAGYCNLINANTGKMVATMRPKRGPFEKAIYNFGKALKDWISYHPNAINLHGFEDPIGFKN